MGQLQAETDEKVTELKNELDNNAGMRVWRGIWALEVRGWGVEGCRRGL